MKIFSLQVKGPYFINRLLLFIALQVCFTSKLLKWWYKTFSILILSQCNYKSIETKLNYILHYFGSYQYKFWIKFVCLIEGLYFFAPFCNRFVQLFQKNLHFNYGVHLFCARQKLGRRVAATRYQPRWNETIAFRSPRLHSRFSFS